jgi:hypothetical protein
MVGAALATSALWSLAGEKAADAQAQAGGIPRAALDGIIKQSIANIQKALKKPTVKANAAAVRSNAFLIAAAAQQAIDGKAGNAAQFAALRNAALDLAKAAEGKKVGMAQARKAVAFLARWPSGPGDPGAGTRPVDLKSRFELDDVMTMFKKASRPNQGGQGIERTLLILGQKRQPHTAKEMAGVELDAYKIALISPVVREYKDEQKWKTLTDEMQQLSLDLVRAGRAHNAADFKTVLGKLNSNCTACHDKYRSKEE